MKPSAGRPPRSKAKARDSPSPRLRAPGTRTEVGGASGVGSEGTAALSDAVGATGRGRRLALGRLFPVAVCRLAALAGAGVELGHQVTALRAALEVAREQGERVDEGLLVLQPLAGA